MPHGGVAAPTGESIEVYLVASRLKRLRNERTAKIPALGRQFNMDPGAVSDAVARGTSVDEFNRNILDPMATGNATATRLSGLVENVSVPRMTAGTAAEWIAEDAAATESSPVFDAVSLTMKQLSANTRISRR